MDTPDPTCFWRYYQNISLMRAEVEEINASKLWSKSVANNHNFATFICSNDWVLIYEPNLFRLTFQISKFQIARLLLTILASHSTALKRLAFRDFYPIHLFSLPYKFQCSKSLCGDLKQGRLKVDKSGWKWMKEDSSGWMLMKVDEKHIARMKIILVKYKLKLRI